MTLAFTDTQLVLLSAAALREDRCLAPSQRMQGVIARKFEEKLVNAALAIKVAVVTGMPVWRRGANGDPIALRLTAAGLAAIGIEDDSVGTPPLLPNSHDATEATACEQKEAGVEPSEIDRGALEPPSTEVSHGDAHVERGTVDAQAKEDGAQADSEQGAASVPPPSMSTCDPVALAAPNAPRAGSKLAVVIGLLSRPQGAAIDELTTATDWLPHTTRAAITSLRKRGFAVSRSRGEGERERNSIYRIVVQRADAAIVDPDPASEPNAAESSSDTRDGDLDAVVAGKTSSADLTA